MKMTDGEKMVWAAMFAQGYFDTVNACQRVCDTPELMEAYVEDRVPEVMKTACGAVQELRDCRIIVEESLISENDISSLTMLKFILD